MSIKAILIFSIVVLSTNLITIYSQSSGILDIHLQINPYVIPINKPTVEMGEGFNKINGTLLPSESGYADLTWWCLKDFGVSIGAGLHSFRYKVNFLILGKEGFPPQFDQIRDMRSLNWSPSLGVSYRNNKARVTLKYTQFDPITIYSSHNSGVYGNIYRDLNNIDPVETYVISEVIRPGETGQLYSMLQLEVSYEVTNSLSVVAGIESTMSKSAYNHYSILVNRFIGENDTQPVTLNDFRLTANYTAISLGLSYQIGVK